MALNIFFTCHDINHLFTVIFSLFSYKRNETVAGAKWVRKNQISWGEQWIENNIFYLHWSTSKNTFSHKSWKRLKFFFISWQQGALAVNNVVIPIVINFFARALNKWDNDINLHTRKQSLGFLGLKLWELGRKVNFNWEVCKSFNIFKINKKTA
jgi:hypothetical protein